MPSLRPAPSPESASSYRTATVRESVLSSLVIIYKHIDPPMHQVRNEPLVAVVVNE
jgi:hypothetical protein